MATDDGRVRCRGGLVLDGAAPPGALQVDDAALCGRAAGWLTCLRARGVGDRSPTPFAEWLVGPGFPCGRTDAGEVWCADRPAAEGQDAGLVALPTPARVVAMGSAGRDLYLLGADGTLWATPPPAHGGGALRVVATAARGLASDGWTLACWGEGDGTACSDGRRLPAAARLAVGGGVVCGTGSAGTWCAGVDGAALGAGPVDGLVAGSRFACALRAGQISCAGEAP